MPNWCNNNISISGPTDKIRLLWQRANTSNENAGLLNQMHPMPKELEDTTSPSDGPNWYDWRVSNWSTKWDVDTEGLEFTDNEDGTATIEGWFDSAWAPPIGACEFYAEQNPDVRITLDYHEPGMCFVGRALFENGAMEDDCIDYGGANSETVRDMIGEDMDDNWGISEMMAQWEEENEDLIDEN